jgi:hypothetical protein
MRSIDPTLLSTKLSAFALVCPIDQNSGMEFTFAAKGSAEPRTYLELPLCPSVPPILTSESLTVPRKVSVTWGDLQGISVKRRMSKQLTQSPYSNTPQD